MITITAIIRVKSDALAIMRDALLDVADHVSANEPDTVGFFVSQSIEDQCVFTTYERFANKAAMDQHNSCGAVADFFAIAQPILDGPVTLITADEVSFKA